MTCLQEAELNHPELLNLPDDIEICEKAAGYKTLFIQTIVIMSSAIDKQMIKLH